MSFSLISFTQEIHSKLELSYEYVEFYNDTVHIGTIKTHSNIDFYDNGYFMSISCGSERVYHFIYPNSCVYDINRLTFKETDMKINSISIYKNSFKLFRDSVGVVISKDNIRIVTKDYRQIIFHK